MRRGRVGGAGRASGQTMAFAAAAGGAAFILWNLAVGGSSVTATFTVAPSIIRSGETGTFRYRITHNRGRRSVGMEGRPTTFTIVPAAHGRIVSLTDHTGNVLTVNASTGSSTTDEAGDIVVVVQVNAAGPLTLSATDMRQQTTETTSFSGIP